MTKAPIKLKGIRVPGVRVKDGVLVKSNKAPPHVKMAQRKSTKTRPVRRAPA